MTTATGPGQAAITAAAEGEDLPDRDKGSHQIYALVDSSSAEVERFGLTGHPRELSWTVLTRLEERLAPVFGEKWMER